MEAVKLVVVLALAGAALAQSDNGTIPFGVSVAFAGTTTGSRMAVTWNTLESASGNVVLYGTASNSYRFKAAAAETVYYTSSYQHVAVLEDGIKANTRYFYTVGNSESMSDEYSFTTARADGDHSAFSIAVLGDMGIDNSADTMRQLAALGTSVEWMYHVGDISYADDHNSINPGAYENTWNDWTYLMGNVTSNYGYMVCPGNHEASCFSTGSIGCPDHLKNFTAYRNRFRMPSPESGGYNNMWYSFNYGMAHFVSISTETDYKDSPEGPGTLWNSGPFGDQMSWLKDDLQRANADRENHPWIIVIGHRPLYSSSLDDFPLNAKKHLRDAIEQTLYDNDVDMYLCGHVHAYERMYPTFNGVVDPNHYNYPRALTEIVIGNAGDIEGLSAFTNSVPEYEAFRNNEDYGYGILSFKDSTQVTWEARRATDNSVIDSIILLRQH